MIHPYDEDYDLFLNELLDNCEFSANEISPDYLVDIWWNSLWIENHPYGSFALVDSNYMPIPIRASRVTIHRAYEKYLQFLVSTNTDSNNQY